MEEKINIAKILKGKSNGIRLYSPIFGECTFCCVSEDTNDICVKKHNGEKALFDSKGLYYNTGEVMLFPSKQMRDWSKFLWKKGDILVSNDNDSHIIFEGFSKDDYTTFEGKYSINVSKKRYVSYLYMQKTQNYHIEYDKDATQTYINTIEEIFGGKLNRETLEIEKQPEFKDGDILYAEKDESHTDAIFILETVKGKRMYYACLILHPYMECKYSCGGIGNKTLRYATEEEKQQLFEALAKKNKGWDAERKAIVDLKTKWTPKPFDRVITRVDDNAIWAANIFSHIDQNGEYVTIGCIAGYPYCLPYNDETAHLLGTTDEWKGGEG